eukprot:2852141-Pleurochrysis_carterae.AAC.4
MARVETVDSVWSSSRHYNIFSEVSAKLMICPLSHKLYAPWAQAMYRLWQRAGDVHKAYTETDT